MHVLGEIAFVYDVINDWRRENAIIFRMRNTRNCTFIRQGNHIEAWDANICHSLMSFTVRRAKLYTAVLFEASQKAGWSQPLKMSFDHIANLKLG